MKKFSSIIVALFFAITLLPLQAQKEHDILMTIGNQKITVEDFLNSFQKNNSLAKSSQADLQNYLDLYTNFALKVKEGITLHVDTSRSFLMELNAYKTQSAQPYLIDKEVTQNLIDEATERMKYDIRASHILINCSPNANPKDTLAAYNKALELRSKILNKHYSFNDAAALYSDDQSARDMLNSQTGRLQIGNKGDLGYFTLFSLIYPFETAAYNTAVGSISMPVRTRFGYHLIYVVDKIPALENIDISHIFFRDSLAAENNMLSETKINIDAAMKKLNEGIAFEDVAKELSEDVASKTTGGRLNPFSPSRRSGDFVKQSIALTPGSYSKPIASNLGWHIVKLNAVNPVVIDETVIFRLKNQISKDIRSHKSKSSLVEKLKKEYQFNDSGKDKLFKKITKDMPEKFAIDYVFDFSTLSDNEKNSILYSYSGQKQTFHFFLDYLIRFQGVNYEGNMLDFLNERYANFVENEILEYEKTQLENKYPEYSDLVKEYHDGMILFELNSQYVWNKGVKDSVGIIQFYEKNKEKYVIPNTHPKEYKPLNEIKAIVITEYQDYLDKEWIQDLKKKYTVNLNENVWHAVLERVKN